MKTFAQFTTSIEEAILDTGVIIKALISKSFGGSNKEQMGAVQLLKGLALSDDPRANKFMSALDKWTSSLDASKF